MRAETEYAAVQVRVAEPQRMDNTPKTMFSFVQQALDRKKSDWHALARVVACSFFGAGSR